MRPQLRVFWPDDAATDEMDSLIIPMPKFRSVSLKTSGPTQRPATVQRANLLHANRQCPACHAAHVDPIELADGRVDRWRHLIPGTCTIVGFRCEHCQHEWSASAQNDLAADAR